MNPLLTPFLRDLAARPFAWGECDCALALGAWWAANHGVDPTLRLRGSYHDEESCAALLARSGHLPRAAARLAREAGAKRSDGASPGDFAVIRFGDRWYGAIRAQSGRWVVKGSNGVIALPAASVRVVIAWSV